VYCPRCGTEVPDNSSFCNSCGQDLKATTPMAAMAGDPQRTTELDVVRSALAGEYEIMGELGRGGMAIVYHAREIMLDRVVALKVLPFSLAFDADFVERFQREARTAARLEHPNIIPIYRVGRIDNVIYFAMRYLRGQSLAEVIEKEGALSPSVIRELLVEAAGALGYAHKHGIVHRDIKPDNIMFKESGEVVLCDFGIAKAASGTKLTGTGMAIGTPFYMSPEQARAQPLDGRSDLYSLGVVAYQCLTGRVPFEAEDSFSVGYKHIMEDLPVPGLETADQWALFEVIKKMMAKEPNERYQSAEELVALLSAESETALVLPTVSAAPTAPIAAVPAVTLPVGMAASRPVRPSTPTTPMPQSGLGDRVASRRPGKKRRGLLVGALAFLMLGGAGGGFYYVNYMSGAAPDSPGNGAPEAGSGPVDGSGTSSSARSGSGEVPFLAFGGDTATGDSAQGTSVTTSAGDPPDSIAGADSSRSDSSVISTGQEEPETTEPEPARLELGNAGPNASLFIDGRSARGLQHDLPPGQHEIRVQRPGYQDYQVRLDLEAGETVRHRIRWTPTVVSTPPDQPPPPAEGQCDNPGESTYNLNSVCFDLRPQPRVAPLVPVPEGVGGAPTPAVLLLRVAEDGSVEQVRIVTRSSEDLFTVAAVEFAKEMDFGPAQKSGQPVAAWTRQPFQPRPN